MKVFLSHSSRDKALVREIRSHLPEHVTTWLDEEELLVGQDLKISIKSAIEDRVARNIVREMGIVGELKKV